MARTTWRKLISLHFRTFRDSWDFLETCTLSEAELDKTFDNNDGFKEGKPFTLWTKSRVYFPACYCGEEYVFSVARNPDGIPTDHIGS